MAARFGPVMMTASAGFLRNAAAIDGMLRQPLKPRYRSPWQGMRDSSSNGFKAPRGFNETQWTEWPLATNPALVRRAARSIPPRFVHWMTWRMRIGYDYSDGCPGRAD